MHSIQLSQQHPDYIQLIQLTDTHIFASQDTTFDGVDTAESLQRVITLAQNRHWPQDAVLVTGDLVHDPEAKAYERLLEILERISLPVFCIPGNHDDPVLMQKILNRNNVSTTKAIHIGKWQILMLDTFLPGTHAGELAENELQFLDEQLNNNQDRHTLVCLHHSPVSVNSPWMDKMGLQNPDDFFAVVDKYPLVRAVLWGHIHQEFYSMHHNVQLMATPSTCVQFMPKADRYGKDNMTAGYRYLKLFDSGKIETGIQRL